MTIFEDEVLEMCFRSVQLRCFDNKDLSKIKVVRWSTSLVINTKTNVLKNGGNWVRKSTLSNHRPISSCISLS